MGIRDFFKFNKNSINSFNDFILQLNKEDSLKLIKITPNLYSNKIIKPSITYEFDSLNLKKKITYTQYFNFLPLENSQYQIVETICDKMKFLRKNLINLTVKNLVLFDLNLINIEFLDPRLKKPFTEIEFYDFATKFAIETDSYSFS